MCARFFAKYFVVRAMVQPPRFQLPWRRPAARHGEWVEPPLFCAEAMVACCFSARWWARMAAAIIDMSMARLCCSTSGALSRFTVRGSGSIGAAMPGCACCSCACADFYSCKLLLQRCLRAQGAVCPTHRPLVAVPLQGLTCRCCCVLLLLLLFSAVERKR